MTYPTSVVKEALHSGSTLHVVGTNLAVVRNQVIFRSLPYRIAPATCESLVPKSNSFS